MPSSLKPTEEQRKRVKLLAGLGMKQEQIAKLVGVRSTTSLRKHFRDELLQGPVAAAVRVRRTLYEMATSGRNQAATIFWLKTRAGWSEKGREPEMVDEQEQGMQIVVRYVKPRFCEETQRMLPPLEPDESKMRYWKTGENGKEIPVRRPASRKPKKSQPRQLAPPECGDETLES